ncbi:MAG: nicotinamidase [Gallionellales bacterium RIFCSPLOWO2_02_FULL_57_47]|nr:MAG: nicotinamidase [Gallionellales bacterium RIFCSPLOWO2_02_FULL_57_47]
MNTSNRNDLQPKPGDALLIVDVQNDFLPGGSLAVPRGDEVVPVLNRYLRAFTAQNLPIYATRDWHPERHCSFRAQGGIWPPHCVAGTRGAEFAAALQLPSSAVIISKATTAELDAYSGFQGTNLDQQLREAKIRRLFIGGLATDYCVLNTVRDALRLGYEVFLLADAIRAVDVLPGKGQRAEQEMARLGAQRITIERIGV